MNEYCYADIEIGHEESFDTVICQDMMDAFKSMTGDTNPLHNDSDFAIFFFWGGVRRKSSFWLFGVASLLHFGWCLSSRKMVADL